MTTIVGGIVGNVNTVRLSGLLEFAPTDLAWEGSMATRITRNRLVLALMVLMVVLIGAMLVMMAVSSQSARAEATITSPAGEAHRADAAVERERAQLFANLKAAKNNVAGREAENAVWQFWMRQAPDPDIEKRIADAMGARREYNFDKARGILDKVVGAAPDYAEGWNQSAFIHYLQGMPDKSLADIDKALELEPKHFGALSGKARILFEQGRVELSQKALREAIEIHPWLKERTMLLPMPVEQKI